MTNSSHIQYNDPTKPSREERPRAILEWPEGLANPPVIYPLGRSSEESDEIGKRLEKALA